MKWKFNFKIKIIPKHNVDSMTEISLANYGKFESNTNFYFAPARFCHDILIL